MLVNVFKKIFLFLFEEHDSDDLNIFKSYKVSEISRMSQNLQISKTLQIFCKITVIFSFQNVDNSKISNKTIQKEFSIHFVIPKRINISYKC